MYCLSINYKKAPAEIRSRFALSEAERTALAAALSEKGAEQSVILCTCNRTELYFTGASQSAAEELLAAAGNMSRSELSPYLRTYLDSSAQKHLFRVASGIDSMIIGEDEILGQVKSAYQESEQRGSTGFELNTVFQSAIACAKRVKTETALSRTSVSAATLAANEAARLGENVRVLIIGATGKIGGTTLKNLLSHKNISVTQTIRRHNSSLLITAPELKTVDYASRYEAIEQADCIISATTSPHYTVTAEELRPHITDGRQRLFIDLAVPPDIDSAAAGLPGVRLVGIDYFRHLAAENNALKLSSADEAEDIIADELDEMRKKLVFHEFLPKLDSVRSAAGRLTLDELLFRMKSTLDSSQLSAVLSFLEKLPEEA